MFSKPAKTKLPDAGAARPDAAAEAPRKASVACSLIAENLTIEGAVAGEGDLHLDGKIRGDVRIGSLTIGETGLVEGSVTAETVEIRGRVAGSVTAKQVRLYGTAHVDGDITHEQLAIEQGAFFQGRSLKFQRPAPALTLAAENPSDAVGGRSL
jgi:cytoskeletal protein CcmA (bactofilin family)